MILKSYLFSKFILSEIFNLKSKFLYVVNFIKKISLLRLINFYFYKKKYPFRNNDINDFLKKNEKNFDNSCIKNKKKILVDLTLGSHPLYAISNCLISNEIRLIIIFSHKS